MGKTPKTTRATVRRAVSPPARATRASLRAAIVKANAEHSAERVRQYETDDGLIAFLDSLTVKVPASVWNKAQGMGDRARASFLREWCEANGTAGLVRAYDDGFCATRRTVAPEHTNEWRPANAVRERLSHLPSPWCDRFGYVSGETAPKQLARVRALNWRKGQPGDYAGADWVFIFRLP